MIFSAFILLNSNVKVDIKPDHISFFSDKNLNVIGQLLNDNGNIKSWDDIKIELKYTGYKLLMLCQGRRNILF